MSVAEPTIKRRDPLDLLAWDWRAALKREERSLSWLARHTERSESAVNKYARGVLTPPLDWLRAAAIALKVEV